MRVTAGPLRRAATPAAVVLGFGCFAAALGGLSTIGADLRAVGATTTPATRIPVGERHAGGSTEDSGAAARRHVPAVKGALGQPAD
jgi:hypothetical protein